MGKGELNMYENHEFVAKVILLEDIYRHEYYFALHKNDAALLRNPVTENSEER